jgi:hypothetical protein
MRQRPPAPFGLPADGIEMPRPGTPPGGPPPVTLANVPPIVDAPAAPITFTAGKVQIPN